MTIYGKVIEVYIPLKNNEDVMTNNKIGFKVKVGQEVITIEQEQNEINSKIYKDDTVEIIKQVINGKEFIDIESIDCDLNLYLLIFFDSFCHNDNCKIFSYVASFFCIITGVFK